jgi:predicted amino acid racemase
MFIRTPRLEIYTHRIEENVRTIADLCHQAGGSIASITKVVSAHPAVVRAMDAGGVDMIADSRIFNLQAMANTGMSLPLMLLRIPAPSRAADVVRCADVSLNSSVYTIEKISEAAHFLDVTHKVIIMVDVGDLREGVWPDKVADVVRGAAHLPNVEVIGLGCNLACYGGVIPTRENMQILVDVRDECRRVTGLELPVLSGANSASLPLLLRGEMPKEINHYRIGEAILLGRNVIDRTPWPGARQDTFRVVAEIVEIERKPSIPIGNRGQDAFGGYIDFVDRGLRKRAICNIGRQDVVVDGITPEDEGIIVLGGSSDHLILDVEDAKTPVKLGSEVAFYPGYGALLSASTSSYVQKVVIKG